MLRTYAEIFKFIKSRLLYRVVSNNIWFKAVKSDVRNFLQKTKQKGYLEPRLISQSAPIRQPRRNFVVQKLFVIIAKYVRKFFIIEKMIRNYAKISNNSWFKAEKN